MTSSSIGPYIKSFDVHAYAIFYSCFCKKDRKHVHFDWKRKRNEARSYTCPSVDCCPLRQLAYFVNCSTRLE